MTKEYWITNSRFKLIALFLFLMFVIFMVFLYLKADEITKDPCSICASYQSEKMVCTIESGGRIMQRIYYPNFVIEDSIVGGGNSSGFFILP